MSRTGHQGVITEGERNRDDVAKEGTKESHQLRKDPWSCEDRPREMEEVSVNWVDSTSDRGQSWDWTLYPYRRYPICIYRRMCMKVNDPS